jgi:glutamyl-tRNA synthetase
LSVRTRVAPSPTGDPHVGTAYVALVNYCFARKNGGTFVLRIEDTDRSRSTVESEEAILESLHWLGVRWGEGPDVGGARGPYRQSERSTLYREHVEKLLADGNAFKCFCTPERLEEMRVAQRAAHQPPHYDGRCLSLSAAEIAANESGGIPFVVRMKVPAEGSCAFTDVLRGRIEIEWKSVDMQVLLKSDGFPTYHLANVVDDHFMEISHVIRGEEWISSAPKHVLLYGYFGWRVPELCHLPLLRNPDKSKLSKRKNPTSILYYRQQGYPAEALLHFLGTLVDSRNDDSRFVGRGDGAAERIELLLEAFGADFDLSRISVGGPVFDIPKLRSLSGQWIRSLSPEQFLTRLEAWGFDWPRQIAPEKREHVARIAIDRIETFADFGPAIEFLAAAPDVSRRDLVVPKASDEQARQAFESAIGALSAPDGSPWDQAAIGATLKRSIEAVNLRFKDIVRLFYIAITGSPTSLPLFDGMEILGRQESLRRLRIALEKLH